MINLALKLQETKTSLEIGKRERDREGRGEGTIMIPRRGYKCQSIQFISSTKNHEEQQQSSYYRRCVFLFSVPLLKYNPQRSNDLIRKLVQ